ncbi:MAG: alpha/beta fold hydrolase [Pseudomonadota bacterium]
MKYLILTITVLTCVVQIAFASDLARRAQWDARFELSTDGATVTELKTSSPLHSVGIRVGDKILSVDEQAISNAAVWDDVTDALVAGREFKLVVLKDQTTSSYSVQFDPIVKESYPNIFVEYNQVTSAHGVKQRTIVTRPADAATPSPAIIVLQGLSCSSIEYTPGRKSNFIKLLQDLVTKSGMAVLRTEKPGLGDSEGNCSQTDLDTELAGYDAAITAFLARNDIEASKTVVYGSSMGSALAPYFAQKFQLAGVISDGTYLKTWFEHMLEIERRIQRMQGKTQAEITRAMNEGYIPLYYVMLVAQDSYANLIENDPTLAPYNYHQPHHMYGRPMSFYHDLQRFDVAGAWQSLDLDIPVRLRWGTSDWIMTESDNQQIVAILNRRGHTDVEYYQHPGLDHFDTIQQSPEDSFNGVEGKWDPAISEKIIGWAQEIIGGG